jgi:triacylglycerol lipase
MFDKARFAIVGLLMACMVMAAGETRAEERMLPIVFVHGNGDTAGLWITTMWRFESNGWPRDLLHAVDLRYPLARGVDEKPEAGRSSTAEVMHQLADEIAAVQKRTGAEKVILIGQSRGGNTVRNYLKNGGGAEHVAMAILCGAVNHGVIISDKDLIGSEFNGASPFMRDLNGTPDEVVPGVRFMTIRSDSNDKYAQPDGLFLGHKGEPTGLTYEAPALKGATNVVLPGVDHRETGFNAPAFEAMFRFITGHAPAAAEIAAEAHPVLNGKVSGFENASPTNIGIAGANVSVYKVSAETGERLGAALHEKTTGADGIWGPFTAESGAAYEFVVAADGYPVTHIYRSPFARSSDVLHFRPQAFAADDKEAGAVVYMTRPRGYFGIDRDVIKLDGELPSGINSGVPGTSSAKKAFPASPPHAVTAVFNNETIVARTWPAAENNVSVAELTY